MALVARIALAALLVTGVFVVPPAEPQRLAARAAHELFAQPAAESSVTFGELVLAGPHVYDRTADSLRFSLAGVRMEGVSVGSLAHLDLRTSIVRGLRSAAAELPGAEGDGGYALIVPGEDSPVIRGASFLGSLQGDALVLEYTPLEGEAVTTSMPWRASSRLPLVLPIVAVALAVLFRRPFLALFSGVLAGAVVLEWCVFAEAYRPWHAWAVGCVLLVLVLVLRGKRAVEPNAEATTRPTATRFAKTGAKIGGAAGTLSAFLFAVDWIGDRGLQGPDVTLVVNTIINVVIFCGGGIAAGSLLGWIVDQSTQSKKDRIADSPG